MKMIRVPKYFHSLFYDDSTTVCVHINISKSNAVNWPITNITMTSKRARGCYAREWSLVASRQTSCQNVGNLSTLGRHSATLPNPTVPDNDHCRTLTQLLVFVGECWRMLAFVGAVCKLL